MAVLGTIEGGAGIIMTFVANFSAGMLNYLTSQTPPSLNGAFANFVSRFDSTGKAMDLQLATYYAAPATYWNTPFTFNGNTVALSDLASGEFPAETDPAFEKAGNLALFTMEQTICANTLQQFYSVMNWLPAPQAGPLGYFVSGTQDSPPIAWVQQNYSNDDSYYYTWTWSLATSGCAGTPAGWKIAEYSLGTCGFANWGPLNRDACNYLFTDSTPGTTTTPNGLFTREKVFTGLNLKQQSYQDQVWNGGGVMSFASMRALKENRTLSALVRSEGRQSVTVRVIAKVSQDPGFLLDLQINPRETVEKFLEVVIPEPVAFYVIVENPLVYGVVIPRDLPPVAAVVPDKEPEKN
jgi:hypothetical protein